MATHLIFGLPGETEEQMLKTIDLISSLPIRGIKLHHLHVVKGTALAKKYETAPFPTFGLDDYASLLGRALDRLREDIIVFRIFGVCPENLLIAPHWPGSKAGIQHRIETLLRQAGVRQGRDLRPLAAKRSRALPSFAC